MPWTNIRYGKATADGMTNPIKVRCGHCGTSQYLTGSKGDWRCYSCLKMN